MNLDRKNLPAYLQRKHLVAKNESVQIQPFGDGIKNVVFKVNTEDRRMYVKQALSKAQVKERWWLDRKRIFQESACLDILAEILPPEVVPEVILEDRTDFVLVTSAPPKDAQLWDQQLERGRIDLQIAAQCGELLATVHNETIDNRDLKSLFKDTKPFEQLRLEPCYGRVIQSFPDLKKIIDAQSRHLLRDRRSLVLGDLRPRNVWIDTGQVYLVDFAAAHYGNPSFDLAFYSSDLCLRAMRHSMQKAAYLEAINVYWNSYFRIAEYPNAVESERAAVRDLGCLLLSATDGREPVDYFSEPMVGLSRRIAQSLIFTELEKIEDITEFINRTLIDG
jgi:5-methylthioribose kinase